MLLRSYCCIHNYSRCCVVCCPDCCCVVVTAVALLYTPRFHTCSYDGLFTLADSLPIPILIRTVKFHTGQSVSPSQHLNAGLGSESESGSVNVNRLWQRISYNSKFTKIALLSKMNKILSNYTGSRLLCSNHWGALDGCNRTFFNVTVNNYIRHSRAFVVTELVVSGKNK